MLVSEANRLRRRVVAAKFVTLLLEMGNAVGGELFLLVGKIEVCTEKYCLPGGILRRLLGS